MTCSLHFKIFNYNVVISNVFFSLAKDIFRFVTLRNSVYSAK